VVHEDAGVLRHEAEPVRLTRVDGLERLVRRDLGRVVVDRVRHAHVHLLRRAVDERDLDLVSLRHDHRLGHAGTPVELAVDRVGPHPRGGLVRGDLRDVLVHVDAELLHRAGGRRRKRGVGPRVLLDLAVEGRLVARVLVPEGGGLGGLLLGRRLGHDGIVAAAVEGDDEPNRRDRGPGG
jgi:hypothetical protein